MKLFKSYVFMAVFAASAAFPAFAAQPEEKAEVRAVLDTVVVTATKTEHNIADVPVQTYVIGSEEIEKSNASTLSELLKSIPGFNFSQQNNIPASMGYTNTVRGLNIESRYMLVLVDGQRVFTGYRSGGMASGGFGHNVNAVPLELIDHVEIVTGPSSALYGSDAVVGVMNIITKKTDAPTAVGGSYTWYQVGGNDYLGTKAEDTVRSMQEAHAMVSGKIFDNLSVMGFINYNQNDGTHPELYDVRLTNLTGKADWRILPGLSLNFGGEYNYWQEQDKKGTADNEEKSPRLFATLNYNPNQAHNVTLNAYTHHLDGNYSSVLYGASRADVRYKVAELQYSFGGLKNFMITAGGEFLREEVKSSGIEDISTDTKSIYGQVEWKLFDGALVIVPGVRFDDNEQYGSELNPKLSLMYRPLDDTTIRLSAGRSFKAPNGMQTHSEPINHVAMWVLSNPDLDPETSVTYQGGIEQYLFNRRLMLSATYYHMSLKDMIVQTDGGFYMGLPVIVYGNVDEARVNGVEAVANITISQSLDLGLTYTYTNAKNKTTGKPLEYAPRHMASGVINYVNREWDFGASIFGTFTDAQKNLIVTPVSPQETKSYGTMGLTVWKEVNDTLKMKFTANNLLDEKMRDSDTIYVGRSFALALEGVF